MHPFYCVEGLEGASKSTSIATINRVFTEHHVPLHNVREPGGTPLAEELRSLIKSPRHENVDMLTELLIMFAARNQLYINKIIPELKSHAILSDRGWWSSSAYQLSARAYDASTRVLFQKIKDAVVGAVPYTAVLFLDVDPAVGLMRASKRSELDRFEQKQITFFENARLGYLELCKTQPGVTIIDANRSLDDVQYDVEQWALSLLKNHHSQK